MSLGYYRVIKGRLIVRPKQSPDGDSMRFIADDMSLFDTLPHHVLPKANANGEVSYQLRFQAIDTPELHYSGVGQPHGLESRNGLLNWLGVNPADWDWVVAPNGFSWEHPAVILCDGFEGHGRPIAFVLKSIKAKDGATVKLTKTLLPQTYNHFAIKSGLAYLGIYSGGLAADVQSSLIKAYKSAKSDKLGVWQLDTTNRFTVNSLDDISPESSNLIYPKIFRRCVDALRFVGGTFAPGSDLDDFLFAKPDEDDYFIVKAVNGGKIKSRLSNVIEQMNNQIQIQVDLNTVEFISK